MAGDSDGDFVIAWAVGGYAEHDILARRFDVSSSMDADGNSEVDPLTDGILLMRYQFGFTGATLIAGAVGAGCTRCDATSILSYLQTLQ